MLSTLSLSCEKMISVLAFFYSRWIQPMQRCDPLVYKTTHENEMIQGTIPGTTLMRNHTGHLTVIIEAR